MFCTWHGISTFWKPDYLALKCMAKCILILELNQKTTQLDLSFPLERVTNERSSFMHTEHVSTHYEARVKILNYKKAP